MHVNGMRHRQRTNRTLIYILSNIHTTPTKQIKSNNKSHSIYILLVLPYSISCHVLLYFFFSVFFLIFLFTREAPLQIQSQNPPTHNNCISFPRKYLHLELNFTENEIKKKVTYISGNKIASQYQQTKTCIA